MRSQIHHERLSRKIFVGLFLGLASSVLCAHQVIVNRSALKPTACSEITDPAVTAKLAASVELHDLNGSLADVVEQLRRQAGLPLSFIDDLSGRPVSFKSKSTTSSSILQEIIRQRPGYRCASVNGHMVLYPDDPRYKLHSRAPEMRDVPRYVAARRYVASLRRELGEFSELQEPLMAASLEYPLYGEPISMGGDDLVLSQFIRLLGANADIYFTIGRARSGAYSFSLGSQEGLRLPPPSAARQK